MAVICPAILASNKEEYTEQVHNIVHVANRIQIDLTDGLFAPSKTVSADEAWWPAGFKADIHLMYKNPLPALTKLLPHKPNLVIIHAESEGNFDQIISICHNHSVKVGIALLAQTAAETILPVLGDIQHAMIFSGNLGYQGGAHADLSLLDKVTILKQHKHELEIGWDGGINDQNVSQLVSGGVDVLNVGGYIQKANDPVKAFQSLQRIADETGTT